MRRALILGALLTILTAVRAEAADPSPQVTVKIERDTSGAANAISPLHQYFIVSVLDQKTGQLDPNTYEVFVTPVDETGKAFENYNLLPRHATYHDAPLGTYGGLVIFSHGGNWKLVATVNKYVSEIDKINDRSLRNAPPVTYARGEQAFAVEGPALESSGKEAFFGKDARSRPNWSAVPIAMLWIHSLAAMGWGAIVAVLVLLALPFGRQLLSERGSNFFDERMGLLLRVYWWTTAAVVGTGVYNLFKNVVYRTPFTPAKVHQVFLLPYGKAYFLALFVKLAVYFTMIALVIPLVREAKRRASALRVAPAEATAVAAPAAYQEDSDPWARQVAVLARPTKVETAPVAEEETRWTIKGAVGFILVGVPVLFFCVTVLKDMHNLAESLRYFTGG
jgi:hypothetical protein